jgi:CRP-like cAMP-binding protein
MQKPQKSAWCGGCRFTPAECRFQRDSCEPGTRLATQYAPPDEVLLVRRGTVLLTSSSGQGSEMTLRGPGTLIGAESLRRAPSSFDAWSLTPVLLCRVPAASLRDWVAPQGSPNGAIDFLVDELVELAPGRAARGR